MINLRTLEIGELLVSTYKSETILGLSSKIDLIKVIDYTDDGNQMRHDESVTQEREATTAPRTGRHCT